MNDEPPSPAPVPHDPPPGASAELARRFAPDLVPAGGERPITADQTNRSVVVDEAVIVKWFRPPRAQPHHGSEMQAHLAEVGFDAMPEFIGSHVVDGVVVASLAGYLRGASDGWGWYLDEVHAWFDGALPAGVLERRATAVGTLAGRLHVALATPSGQWPAPVGAVPASVPFDRMHALFARARAVTTGETAERLAGRWTQIRAAIEPVGIHPDSLTPTIAVHGDLHVGNVLAVGDRLVVTDFDGNPLSDNAAVRQPAAVDVASLLQSIDHLGRIVDHRTGGSRRVDVAAFIADSVERALGAYRAELATASLGHLLDDSLLAALRVAQELHELAYAAAHLPHWVYVPVAALSALFPTEPFPTETFPTEDY